MKAIRRPTTVEYIQYTGDNLEEVLAFINQARKIQHSIEHGCIIIHNQIENLVIFKNCYVVFNDFMDSLTVYADTVFHLKYEVQNDTK